MNFPEILERKWNYVKLLWGNKLYEYGKDCGRADLILTFNSIEKWDWKNSETICDHHFPGITSQAIQYLVDKGCDTIILTKGYGDPTFKSLGVLQTDPKVIKDFESRKITIYHLKSELATEKWNELIRQNLKVGMLLHSTC